MRGRGSLGGTLINAGSRQAAFLTLTLLFVLGSRLSHADALPPADAALAKQKISEVTTYIRKESLQGISLLPDETRRVLGWFSGNWHQVQVQDAPEDANASQEMPDQQNVPRPAPDQTFGLASNFHHKGFLPTHDAMMMGLNMKQNIMPNKLSLTGRPFYGQNWHSLQSYWGGEIALDIDRREDDLPWGKIALGYIGGNESMIDHGRGIDLHGDIDLTNGFKFTSGVRQNSSDGNSNYMIVRWRLEFR